MPKTLAEIKKMSAYPEEFEKAIDYLKTTREHTPAVVAAIEKLIRAAPSKHLRSNELERMAQLATKYMPHFVSGSFYETLQATGDVCLAVAKKEREIELEAFNRVVAPMKGWLQEDFPRLMKDVKKCYALKDKMDRAMASTEARNTPERLAKAEEAKKKHQEFYERVKSEYNFEREAVGAFAAAFTKCEAEIEAGVMALKEARRNVTVEERLEEAKESVRKDEKDDKGKGNDTDKDKGGDKESGKEGDKDKEGESDKDKED